MIGGYVRLSRDDDRRNYVSIENQKLLILQYAKKAGLHIDKWYEDDGVSGYLFERPGFCEMMEDLKGNLEMVIVKDFSRLGRHNAKVLLLVDEFSRRRKRLVVIDDHYDSDKEEDDILGIKTWYNERYVKDTSRKIRSVIGAMQQEGTYKANVPFGYFRCGKNQEEIEIVEEEADVVRQIFDFYLEGDGYRKIAERLNERMQETPSMLQYKRLVREGKRCNRSIATRWSESMVKDIVCNDFYIGTYRLHKRTRAGIHGNEVRIKKEEQCVFKEHHKAVIEPEVFCRAEEIRMNRYKSCYRGKGCGNNPLSNLIFCDGCKKHLTPIKRKGRTYYICSTYNSKGREYCEKSHSIPREEVLFHIRNALFVYLDLPDGNKITWSTKETLELEKKRNHEEKELKEIEKQLEVIVVQKIKELSKQTQEQEMVEKIYERIEKQLFDRRHRLLEEGKTKKKTEEIITWKKHIESLLTKENLTEEEIGSLFQKVMVDQEGMPTIYLKFAVNGRNTVELENLLNHREEKVT